MAIRSTCGSCVSPKYVPHECRLSDRWLAILLLVAGHTYLVASPIASRADRRLGTTEKPENPGLRGTGDGVTAQQTGQTQPIDNRQTATATFGSAWAKRIRGGETAGKAHDGRERALDLSRGHRLTGFVFSSFSLHPSSLRLRLYLCAACLCVLNEALPCPFHPLVEKRQN